MIRFRASLRVSVETVMMTHALAIGVDPTLYAEMRLDEYERAVKAAKKRRMS